MSNNKLFVVMGVSGCGKSTVGKLLAEQLNLPFYDGDDFHPQKNKDKMASGIPLNDQDRLDWLLTLNQSLRSNANQGAVLACSALKEKYRTVLAKGIRKELSFIYLKGDFKMISNRLKQRKNHFMPPALLQSQFKDLEEPKGAVTVSIERGPKEIINGLLVLLQTK